MELCELFKINGKPMFAPNADVSFSFTDKEDSSTGYDESGEKHRFVVKYNVMTGNFVFSFLSEAEYNYMESLFPEEPDFLFTHPSRLDANVPETTRCYRSTYGIVWHNAKKGQWRNYKFKISQC